MEHLCKFREYVYKRTVWACQMEREFTVTTAHNQITGLPGDYLIITPEGEMVPIKKDAFEKGEYTLVACPRDFCEATDCECAKTVRAMLAQSEYQLAQK